MVIVVYLSSGSVGADQHIYIHRQEYLEKIDLLSFIQGCARYKAMPSLKDGPFYLDNDDDQEESSWTLVQSDINLVFS